MWSRVITVYHSCPLAIILCRFISFQAMKASPPPSFRLLLFPPLHTSTCILPFIPTTPQTRSSYTFSAIAIGLIISQTTSLLGPLELSRPLASSYTHAAWSPAIFARHEELPGCSTPDGTAPPSCQCKAANSSRCFCLYDYC